MNLGKYFLRKTRNFVLLVDLPTNVDIDGSMDISSEELGPQNTTCENRLT